jgi:hypothetical protein
MIRIHFEYAMLDGVLWSKAKLLGPFGAASQSFPNIKNHLDNQLLSEDL